MKAITRFTLLLLAAIIISGGIFISCDSTSEAEQVKEDFETLGEDISDLVEKERDQLVANLEETRDDIDDQIAVLKDDWQEASIDARAALNEDITQLEAWAEEIDTQIDQSTKAASENWRAFADATKEKVQEIDQKMEDLFTDNNS